MPYPLPPASILQHLNEGQVIPAHPLALTRERKLDEKHQRALTRYYLHAGAGGIAVGVHTTQFEIRAPEHGLLQPVLELAAATVGEFEAQHPGKQIIRVAGIVGKTEQAVRESRLARELGYHIGLLSLGALQQASTDELLQHADQVAREIPVMGFYLQPSVGGRILDYEFWRKFFEIPNVVAVKMAPFNRYQTLDVIRAVADCGRTHEIALYTGNDDTILFDLLSSFDLTDGKNSTSLRVVGGLLGHWAFWTRKAVEYHREARQLQLSGGAISQDLLRLAWQITDANAAAFDPQHHFHGCISGINEILRRQGLMQERVCLNPNEDLSPGQMEEIDRVYQTYPHLHDDEFVRQHLDEWLR
ncbi:MAG: dihydrodipicolinate synthase family protein [bacterium]